MQYNHRKIEDKWNKLWLKNGIYEPDFKKAKKPFYNLMMFPYPSAEGLHIGAVRTFSGVDIYGRMKRMRGYDVFEPIGLDGFGIHSENYALKIGKHPIQHAKDSEKNFYRQLAMMGNGFSWDEKLETYDPKYYKWTQWIFVRMFKRGLAYRKKSPVNWCPSCLTVLADEQVINGECERCGTKVLKKDLEQWFFKITDYAERLLKNLEKLNWSETVKIAQKNWIGKSEGAEIEFLIPLGKEKKIAVNDIFKFRSSLIGPILTGKKTVTFRLEPKNLKKGDYFKVIEWESGRSFALAKVEKVEEKKLKEIPLDFEGHEKDFSFEERRKRYEIYYKRKVSNEDKVWIYHFSLVAFLLPVFTTRPDTLFGATYLVLAPEHQLISKIKNQISNIKEVDNYIKAARAKTDEERIADGKEKTGAELKGIKAVNPANNEEISVWVADFVLQQYGSGAIFADAHDERDFQFAKRYGIPLKPTLKTGDSMRDARIQKLQECFTGDGILYDSGKFSGMKSEEARKEIMRWLEKSGQGKAVTTYRLRDWLVSRQRYWGPPIPMIFCEYCKRESKGERGDMPGWFSVKEKDLPVKLPNIKNFRPTGKGTGPLGSVKSFYEFKCPSCGKTARRETDVSDAFLDSAWYYLGYLILGAQNAKRKTQNFILPKDLIKKWLPVDMYIGGAEHSVLHLLYSRFIAMAFHDFGMLNFEEPFKIFRAHGLITKDGAKMSKSKGNVVNPDEYFKVYGTDVMRMYLAFMSPLYQNGDFRDEGIIGMTRFLGRIFNLISNGQRINDATINRIVDKTIKKVTEDIESLQYNTAISALMSLLNNFEIDGFSDRDAKIFLKLLAPFAPFITEELWRGVFKEKKSIHLSPWPEYDSKLIEEDMVTIIVQINGKMRGKFEAEKGLSENEVRKLVFGSEKIKSIVGDQAKIKKFIYVKNRLVNIVF